MFASLISPLAAAAPPGVGIEGERRGSHRAPAPGKREDRSKHARARVVILRLCAREGGGGGRCTRTGLTPGREGHAHFVHVQTWGQGFGFWVSGFRAASRGTNRGGC